MAQTARQRGGRPQEVEGEAGEAQNHARRRGEKDGGAQEAGGGASRARDWGEETARHRGEATAPRGGREEAPGDDAGAQGPEQGQGAQLHHHQARRLGRGIVCGWRFDGIDDAFLQSNLSAAQLERNKTKEQLEEEKKISLSIRIKPLVLDNIGIDKLRTKAQELWECIVKLETEKYDLEERQKRQDYDVSSITSFVIFVD